MLDLLECAKSLRDKRPSEYLGETNTDKIGSPYHDYGPVYNLLISSLVIYNGGPINILEIGVSRFGFGSGHAFCNMPYVEKFVGVDIKPLRKPFCSGFGGKGVFFQGDAYTEEMVERVKPEGPFHLLIDDGDHCIASQKKFFEFYLEVFAIPSVIYCEDMRLDEANLLVSHIVSLYPSDIPLVSRSFFVKARNSHSVMLCRFAGAVS